MTVSDFKNFLNRKNCLKIVCGAGNKDLNKITNLCALYAAGGCRFFDVNASVEAIHAAKKGFKYAGKEKEVFICVSVGTKEDPHFTKYCINPEKCSNCGVCTDICLEKAVTQTNNSYSIKENKCIGCGKCFNICKNRAIESFHKAIPFSDLISKITNEDIDCLEYHIITDNIKEISEGWKIITNLYSGPVSVCLDRSKFGNENIIKILKEMKNFCNNLFIVQADGAPMSGGEDDYGTTLQAVATADIIDKAGITPYIFISGGTNSKTKELAKMCSVDVTGISIGTYARKIVRKFIEEDDFLTNKTSFDKALEVIRCIV